MNALKNKPAVLDKIIQEHEILREKLGHIHSVFSEPEPTTEEIEALLREFLNTLIVHFKNEEDEGFFDEVVSRSPQLVGEAGELRLEHKHLLHETNDLCHFAAAGAPSIPWWRELSSRCHVLSKKLMQHESEESRLLQRAFHDEVASGLEICS